MTETDSLLSRIESARTREEAVAVFREAYKHIPPPIDYRFLHEAIAERDDDRALGYLLLAALEARPEGYSLELKSANHRRGWFAALWRPERLGRAGNAHFHCTAMLAAIMKAPGDA